MAERGEREGRYGGDGALDRGGFIPEKCNQIFFLLFGARKVDLPPPLLPSHEVGIHYTIL